MTTITGHSPVTVSGPRNYELTPAQEHTFTELLGIGGERPVTPPGLVDELTAIIHDGTAAAMGHWTEGRLWISKSGLFSALRCESAYLAEREVVSSVMHPATCVGIVSHRAIQIAHTHPRLSPYEAVEAGLEGALGEDGFGRFWTEASIGVQSDLLMQMTSRVTLFLDSWPRLSAAWSPRFEESIQAKVGGVTLAARPDLVLGRPRANGQQTMLLCDLKSGSIQDHHFDEAQFYALVSALRFGVAPYRSMIYSLASGTYTEPDVTPDTLRSAAQRVTAGVNSIVDVMTERRAPTTSGGSQCRWCPLRATCETGQAELAAPANVTAARAA